MEMKGQKENIQDKSGELKRYSSIELAFHPEDKIPKSGFLSPYII